MNFVCLRATVLPADVSVESLVLSADVSVESLVFNFVRR